MSGKKQKESVLNKSSSSHKLSMKLSSSRQENIKLTQRENGGVDVSNQCFREGAYIPNGFEQLVMQAIFNILSDPTNTQIIFDHITQTAHQSSHSKNILQNVFQSRDVSNHEIIRPCDLPQVTGLSRTTIHRLRKDKLFVPHIKLSSGAIGFSRELIRGWLKSREGDK